MTQQADNFLIESNFVVFSREVCAVKWKFYSEFSKKNLSPYFLFSVVSRCHHRVVGGWDGYSGPIARLLRIFSKQLRFQDPFTKHT